MIDFLLKKGLSWLNLTRAAQVHQLLRQGSGILTGILMAKYAGSLLLVGQYEAFTYTIVSLSFFWVNAFGQGLLSFGVSFPTNERADVYANIFLVYIYAAIAVGLLLVTCPTKVSEWLLGASQWPFGSLLGLYAVLHLPSFFLESFWIATSQPKRLLAYGLLTYTTYPLSIAGVLVFEGGLTAILWALCLHAAVRLVWACAEIAPLTRFRVSWQWAFVQSTAPLVVYALINGATQVLSTTLISHYTSGDAALFALFRYGSREIPIVLALSMALSNSFVPTLAASDASDEALATFRQAINKLYYTIFPISIALFIAAPWLFNHIFHPDFKAAVPIFQAFVALVLSRALFPQTIVLALQQHRLLLVMAVIETGVIIGLGWWWLPIYGLEGMAWATVVGYFIEKIGLMSYIWYKNSIHPSKYTPLTTYTVGAFLLLGVYIWEKYG